MTHFSIRYLTFLCFTVSLVMVLLSFSRTEQEGAYVQHVKSRIQSLQFQEQKLLDIIQHSNPDVASDKQRISAQLQQTRNAMKPADFWLRYLNALAHKKINGPLPVEWETEVFEKFEKPYRREGAGLTLAFQELDETHPDKTVLLNLIGQATSNTDAYLVDSITNELNTFHHFYFCNRLFLLNLAAIYTTGFECPDATQVIPELKLMLAEMKVTYSLFNQSFPETPLSVSYLDLYDEAIQFVSTQPTSIETFDHFRFIRDFVNPLYRYNQEHILTYRASSHNLLDYSLSKQATSIFSKSLYNGQYPKGIFSRLQDTAQLAQLAAIGKLLFFDPLLSQNNERSCASCHNPNQSFTDTTVTTALQLNRLDTLNRNTPSLLNVQYNHLLMADGSHFTLTGQTKGVITSPIEMGSREDEVVQKVMSCKQYASFFSKLLTYTPQEKTVTLDHISSAITYYYGSFSKNTAPFDEAMNEQAQLTPEAHKGFNLFMGKAQCATCHFVPQFNGVKPPYIGSEFEVIGVPSSPSYTALSSDQGRYLVNPSRETLHAFRTGTIRNSAQTQPYMHNGVFKTLTEVIDFYNQGGGAGKGLSVPNQTLSSDSLQLTAEEKTYLIAFMESLTERTKVELPPTALPPSRNKLFNQRKVGGSY